MRRPRRQPARLRCDALEDRTNPGSGQFVAGPALSGAFDFAVSVRGHASAADIKAIQTAFQGASDVLADATDGQHRFGTVTIINDAAGGEAAEFWVYPGRGRASAPTDKFGLRGYHANLFLGSNFAARDGAAGDAYTVVHEFARLAYGLEDEDAGPNGPAEGASVGAEGPGLSHSIMDNFFARGGRADGGTAYTLNEFSVRSQFDPDGDTAQFRANRAADWDTIFTSRFPAAIPAGLPVDAPPPSVPVTFDTASGILQSVLVIDRSNSMFDNGTAGVNTQIFSAERGAAGYVDFTPFGLGVGLTSFAKFADVYNDNTAAPRFTLRTLAAAADKTAIQGQIANLDTIKNLATNISAGVIAARSQILGQAVRSKNEAIVLLTDGEFTTGGDPVLLADSLRAAGISVYTIGVGTTLSGKGERSLADLAGRTGGVYTRVTAPFDTEVTLLGLSQELQGNGLIGATSQQKLAAGETVNTAVTVEAGAAQVLFTSIKENAADGVGFTVRSPSGRVISLTSTDADVETTNDAKTIRAIRVTNNPEPGVWTITNNSTAGTSGVFQSSAYAVHPGTTVSVTVGSAAQGGTFAYPAPLPIRATPQFEGVNVTGAKVTGVVTAPDGTTTTNVTLFDDGLFEHGDAVAGDGTYSAMFNQYAGNGTYSVAVTVDGTGATAAAGDALLFPNDPPYSGTVGPFTRLGRGSALVTDVPATVTTNDLGVALQGPVTRLGANDRGTYTVTVTNVGPLAATGVVSHLYLPPGLRVDTLTAGSGTATDKGAVVEFDAGDLPAGGTATLTVGVTALETGAFFATADVGGGGAVDPDLSNNQAVLVPPANTPPALSANTSLTATAGQLSDPLTVVVSDAESRLKFLTLSATTSDPALLPLSGIVFDGTGADRTVRVTPTAKMTGTATVDVTVTDPGGLSATTRFLVTVELPPNVLPTVSQVGNITATAGQPTGPVAFAVDDPDGDPADLVVTATSLTSFLLPTANVVVGGSGANRTVTVTPLAGQTGTATVTLTVTDPRAGQVKGTFTVTVTQAPPPPNTAPTVSAGPPTLTAGQAGIPVTVADAETPAAALLVSAVSSNPAFTVTTGGTGANRTVSVTAAATASGTVTITVSDAGGLTRTVDVPLTITVPPTVPGVPPVAGPAALVGVSLFAAGTDRGGDGTVAFYNPDKSVRFSTQPFGNFTGGVRTASADFNGDGVADVVAGTGPGRATRVVVLDGATQKELFAVDAFEATFTGGVYVTAGDLNGDGRADLVISPDEGGGPRVDIYSGNGFGKLASFFGIDDPNFRGGARAATGDLNGDGRADLVVVAGFGGGPRVAGFDGKTVGGSLTRLFGDFFAFEQTLRNGVFVAAGDIDGDGFAELIAGGGPGGGPRVTAFSGKALLSNSQDVRANFFGGDTNGRGGIRVSVKDLDGDARADIVVGAGAGAGSRVTGYLGKNIATAGTPATTFDFDAFTGSTAGVFVG